MAKSITCARRIVPEILADLANDLTALAREAIGELYDLFRDLDRRIAFFDKKIERIFLESEPCQRWRPFLNSEPSPMAATIAAWVGLVPWQFSNGDRNGAAA
jgi:transposase